MSFFVPGIAEANNDAIAIARRALGVGAAKRRDLVNLIVGPVDRDAIALAVFRPAGDQFGVGDRQRAAGDVAGQSAEIGHLVVTPDKGPPLAATELGGAHRVAGAIDAIRFGPVAAQRAKVGANAGVPGEGPRTHSIDRERAADHLSGDIDRLSITLVKTGQNPEIAHLAVGPEKGVPHPVRGLRGSDDFVVLVNAQCHALGPAQRAKVDGDVPRVVAQSAGGRKPRRGNGRNEAQTKPEWGLERHVHRYPASERC